MIIKIMMAYESFVMVDKSLVSLIVFHGTKIDEQILKCFANKTSRKKKQNCHNLIQMFHAHICVLACLFKRHF